MKGDSLIHTSVDDMRSTLSCAEHGGYLKRMLPSLRSARLHPGCGKTRGEILDRFIRKALELVWRSLERGAVALARAEATVAGLRTRQERRLDEWLRLTEVRPGPGPASSAARDADEAEPA